MKTDELIDDVARAMTAVDARPALRVRVMAGIGDASRSTPRGWIVATAAGATVAVVALVWFLAPWSPVTRDVPMVAEQAPVTAAPPAAVAPAPVEVARTAPARPSVRRAAPAREAAPIVWPDVPTAEIPMLPPLAGPPPIVIEPITWDELTITPLNVESIEVKALVVEPLAPVDRSGV